MKHCLLLCLLLASLAAIGAGCASSADTENASARPWNAPRGWENGLPTEINQGR